MNSPLRMKWNKPIGYVVAIERRGLMNRAGTDVVFVPLSACILQRPIVEVLPTHDSAQRLLEKYLARHREIRCGTVQQVRLEQILACLLQGSVAAVFEVAEGVKDWLVRKRIVTYLTCYERRSFGPKLLADVNLVQMQVTDKSDRLLMREALQELAIRRKTGK
jgi:hypothetical protein